MEELNKLKSELKIRGFSPLTVRNYTFFITKFLEKTNKPAKKLTEEDVKFFLSEMFDTISKNTIMLAHASIKFFFQEVLKKRFNKIPLPKKERSLPEVLTKEEVRKLIESTDTIKSRLIVSLLYSTGLRVSEIVNLKIEDLNLDDKTGWVRRGKGSKDRLFVMSEDIAKELKEYFNTRGKENTYVFSKEKPLTTRNIQKIIKGTKQRAKINTGRKIPKFLNQNKIIFSFAVQAGSNFTNFKGFALSAISLKIGIAIAVVIIANNAQDLNKLSRRFLGLKKRLIGKNKDDTRKIKNRLCA